MKTRNYDWLNIQTGKPPYGFQAFINGEWMCAAENGKPCLFKTTEKRDQKRAEWRKRQSYAGISPIRANFS